MLRKGFSGLLLVLALLPFAGRAEESASDDYVSYIELKPFVANFTSDGPIRFVKCDISIQVSSPEGLNAVNYHLPRIRNDIVFLLSAQREEDLASVEAQQRLSRMALEKVQAVLVAEEGEPYADDLFFTSFVIQ